MDFGNQSPVPGSFIVNQGNREDAALDINKKNLNSSKSNKFVESLHRGAKTRKASFDYDKSNMLPDNSDSCVDLTFSQIKKPFNDENDNNNSDDEINRIFNESELGDSIVERVKQEMRSKKSFSPEQRKYAEVKLLRINDHIKHPSDSVSNDSYNNIDPQKNAKLQLKPNSLAVSSILKQPPRKLDISSDTLRNNPELEEAIVNNTVNPTKAARVLFSPKKTVYSAEESFSPNNYTQEASIEQIGITNESDQSLVPSEQPRRNVQAEKQPRNSQTEKQSNAATSRRKPDDDMTKYDTLPLYTRLFVDPQIPFVISLYVQLTVNLILISIILYFICMFLLTIRTDINNKISSQLIEITQEISLCAREYERNHCSPETRVPALELSCMTWEKCMKRDPKVVGRAKIGAETFAEILNGFIKPISWKSIIFISIGIIGSLVMNNFVFVSYRHYNSPNHYTHQTENQQYITEENNENHPSPSRSFPRLLLGNSPLRNNTLGTPIASSSFYSSPRNQNSPNTNNNPDENEDTNQSTFATPFKSNILNTSLSWASKSPFRLTPGMSPSMRAMLRHRNKEKRGIM